MSILSYVPFKIKWDHREVQFLGRKDSFSSMGISAHTFVTESRQVLISERLMVQHQIGEGE